MTPVTGKTPGNGTATLSYAIPGAGLDVESVYVSVDATGAGGAVTAELTITDQSGVVIARKTQAATIPAGGTGSATWALRLDDDEAASTGGGGIDFDTYPQAGGFLFTESTGTLSGADGADLHARFPAISAGDWATFGTLLLDSGGDDIGIVQPAGGTIDIIATKASSAVLSVQAHQWFADTRFIVFHSDTDMSFDTSGHGSIEFSVDGGGTAGTNFTVAAGNKADISLEVGGGTGAGNIRLKLQKAGSQIIVSDHLNAPIFEVREDGSIHGLAAVGAITWDL